jgi:hypothetical protein
MDGWMVDGQMDKQMGSSKTSLYTVPTPDICSPMLLCLSGKDRCSQAALTHEAEAGSVPC